jgi:hypothetical protein
MLLLGLGRVHTEGNIFILSLGLDKVYMYSHEVGETKMKDIIYTSAGLRESIMKDFIWTFCGLEKSKQKDNLKVIIYTSPGLGDSIPKDIRYTSAGLGSLY